MSTSALPARSPYGFYDYPLLSQNSQSNRITDLDMDSITIGGTSIGKVLSNTSFQQKMMTICFIKNDRGELFVSEGRLFAALFIAYANRDKSDPTLCNQQVTIPFPRLHDQTVIIERIAVRAIFYYTLFTEKSNTFKHDYTAIAYSPKHYERSSFCNVLYALKGDPETQCKLAHECYEDSIDLLQKERDGTIIDVKIIEEENQQKAFFWYNCSAAGGNRQAVVTLLLYFYNYGIVPENLLQLLSQLERLCEEFAQDPGKIKYLAGYCPFGYLPDNGEIRPNEEVIRYFEALIRECYRKNNQVDKALEWGERPLAQGKIETVKQELEEIEAAAQEISHTDKKVRLSDDEKKAILREEQKTELFHKQPAKSYLDSQD